MIVRARPLHCKFETLRLAAEPLRSGQPYHRFGSATNEQLTALGLGRATMIARPVALFADFRQA
ncbi:MULTISPECIES: hypothetical protein [Alphaproteobacteria]|uniref:Uncharacterized protein n=3 Tax=Alphaproteobacteria TaxID=28211 RepID=A0A512HG33_9HYPH|nr:MULTISPECIES: hypothetical protein [Alphaproteobacteria]GEO84413.1 hypothetical protein RNA01_13450 [Ciceribacter naphthalenivorans]GLR22376.1 hypothetical protein GCM10007920_21630 [Ciceribacter naphthalenivorans]GLT05232.1 hypothetical protein GCM10007926_21630 [Sphingomonas psychrolutea]